MNFQEFKNQQSVKHNADLTVGDVIILDIKNEFHMENGIYERVVCDGYCGKDEFFGYIEDTGRRIAWCDNDVFKIIGKSIKLTAPTGKEDKNAN